MTSDFAEAFCSSEQIIRLSKAEVRVDMKDLVKAKVERLFRHAQGFPKWKEVPVGHEATPHRGDAQAPAIKLGTDHHPVL